MPVWSCRNSEGVATGLLLSRRNPFSGASFPGLPKPNPGLKLANAFSVKFKLHQYALMALLDPENNNLRNLLRRARTRRNLLLTMRGLAVVLGAGAAILLLTGWAAHRYRHNESALLWLRLAALVTFLHIAYLALARPLLKRISDARLARLIEEHTPAAADRLVTAVEYSNVAGAPLISTAIRERLQSDADQLAGSLSPGAVIRRSRLLMYGVATVASVLILAGVIKWGPREISEGVNQLIIPRAFAATTNAMSIKVKPGTARV